jgi:hypothetical protein
MLFNRPRVSVQEFEKKSGWHLRPEGLCHDDVCVPFPHSTGELELAAVAHAFGSPLVEDVDAGVWSLGLPVAAHAIACARAPDLMLPDVDGNVFHLESLRGKKVLLLAWASW